MNPNQLTDQLGLFLDVLESGSFSAASRRHPLTPSAVARRIDSLENAVGSQLFIRSTHAVRLPSGHGALSTSCNWPVPKRCR
jgi:DNA-binding transcriptional LysR family regulator